MELVRASSADRGVVESAPARGMVIVRDNGNSAESTEASVTKKGNFFKRGLGKVKGLAGGAGNIAGSVAHKAGDVLGGAKDLGTHLPHPSIPHPDLPRPHLPNINVGGIKDAAGNALGGAGEKIGGALGGAGHLAVESVKLPGRGIGKGVELSRAGTEALINGIGHILENKGAFGKSIAEFALTKGAVGGIKWGGRELSKQIFSLVAGGLAGGPASAAFAGAVVGGAWAYALQVNRNIDRRMADAESNNPDLAERRKGIVRRNISKIKELRHGEVFTKDISRREIIKGVIFGAAAGAGGQALVSHIPGFTEFIAEHAGGLRSLLAPIDQAVGNINTETVSSGLNKAGELAGGVRDVPVVGGVVNTTGDLFGGAGGMIGEGAKVIGEAGGGGLGKAGEFIGEQAGNLGDTVHDWPVIGGAADLGGKAGETIGEGAGNLGRTLGLGGAQEAGDIAKTYVAMPESPILPADQVGEASKMISSLEDASETVENTAVPAGFVPKAEYDALMNRFMESAQTTVPSGTVLRDLLNDVDTIANSGQTGTLAGIEVSPEEAAKFGKIIRAGMELEGLEPPAPGTGVIAGAANALTETGSAAAQATAEQAAASVSTTLLEPIPPTEVHGHWVAGSAIDNTLTYDKVPWVIVENGTKNINHLFEALGEQNSGINPDALAARAQQATNLWAQGKLSPDSDLYTLFHLINGTGGSEGLFGELSTSEDTLVSLKNLGIVSK